MIKGIDRVNVDSRSIKQEGAVYTPRALAKFTAKKIIESASIERTGKIKVLDPALGDGALLEALLSELPENFQNSVIAYGYELDPVALQAAKMKINHSHPGIESHFFNSDFLLSDEDARYDLIIANPPYVRTQALGQKRSQELSAKYGLKGKIDLYHVFFMAIAERISDLGTAGIITSNRFLSTKSGSTVRNILLEKLRLDHIYDLGDTKLFDAAVLPAVTIAHGKSIGIDNIRFSSIYTTSDKSLLHAENVIDALDHSDGDIVAVEEQNYIIKHGLLDTGALQGDVWKIKTADSNEWLSTVANNTWKTFGDIGKIRVGVKSTADKIFIRSDWNLPEGVPELLMPLTTRHCAQRFKAATPKTPKNRKKILYPQTVINGKRTAIPLDSYPITSAYLSANRETLEKRKYLTSSGRKWYELWVPQDPDGWKEPKLVFPDISEKPTFWLDLDGTIVNGECYFLKNDQDLHSDILWLAMAVANSEFTEKFYDSCFNNKLYAGRRRWITQYVEKLPLPDPSSSIGQKLIRLSKEAYEKASLPIIEKISKDINDSVMEAFGLALKIK